MDILPQGPFFQFNRGAKYSIGARLMHGRYEIDPHQLMNRFLSINYLCLLLLLLLLLLLIIIIIIIIIIVILLINLSVGNIIIIIIIYGLNTGD